MLSDGGRHHDFDDARDVFVVVPDDGVGQHSKVSAGWEWRVADWRVTVASTLEGFRRRSGMMHRASILRAGIFGALVLAAVPASAASCASDFVKFYVHETDHKAFATEGGDQPS